MSIVKKLKSTAAILLLGVSFASNSALISVTGSGDILATNPTSVAFDVLESDNKLFAFNELQYITISNLLNIDFDISSSGVSLVGFSGSSSGSGTLGAGTYSSHFIHFDRVSNGVVGSLNNISFTFSGKIVGLIVSKSYLNATDGIFGLATTTYPTGASRRLEDSGDEFSFSGNTLLLSKLRVGSDGNNDQIRVITEVPAPSTFFLIILALVPLVLRAKKRNM